MQKKKKKKKRRPDLKERRNITPQNPSITLTYHTIRSADFQFQLRTYSTKSAVDLCLQIWSKTLDQWVRSSGKQTVNHGQDFSQPDPPQTPKCTYCRRNTSRDRKRSSRSCTYNRFTDDQWREVDTCGHMKDWQRSEGGVGKACLKWTTLLLLPKSVARMRLWISIAIRLRKVRETDCNQSVKLPSGSPSRRVLQASVARERRQANTTKLRNSCKLWPFKLSCRGLDGNATIPKCERDRRKSIFEQLPASRRLQRQASPGNWFARSRLPFCVIVADSNHGRWSILTIFSCDCLF